MDKDKLKSLNKFNLFMGVLHFIQAGLVFFLSDPDKGNVPITLTFLKFDPILTKLIPTTQELFTVNLAWFVIAFFLSLASVKYFITMWKFKNRKKDGSEDDDFKRLD